MDKSDKILSQIGLSKRQKIGRVILFWGYRITNSDTDLVYKQEFIQVMP